MNLEDNTVIWEDPQIWHSRGDDWSGQWGSPTAQWCTTVLPRIIHHLPADRVVEIGCGYGRWTEFLVEHAGHIAAFDLSELCVTSSKQRFSKQDKVNICKTDGMHLNGIAADSVDLVFSWDSLVHSEMDVMESYIREISRILKPNGIAFLHHSNLGTYRTVLSLLGDNLSQKLQQRFLQWRASSVSALTVQMAAKHNGLICAQQELVRWNSRFLWLDCFTTLMYQADSDKLEATIPKKNRLLSDEQASAMRLASLYGPRKT